MSALPAAPLLHTNLRLTTARDNRYRAAVQAWHLQRVLGKKRDPLTHKRLIDALRVGSEAPGSGSLPPSHVFRRFWSAAAEELRAAVAEAVDGNSFLRNTLVDEYPRLRSLLLTTLARLQRSTEGRSGEVALAAGSGGGAGETSAPGDAGVGGSVWEQDRLLGAASQLLQVFLARSLSRCARLFTLPRYALHRLTLLPSCQVERAGGDDVSQLARGCLRRGRRRGRRGGCRR